MEYTGIQNRRCAVLVWYEIWYNIYNKYGVAFTGLDLKESINLQQRLPTEKLDTNYKNDTLPRANNATSNMEYGIRNIPYDCLLHR